MESAPLNDSVGRFPATFSQQRFWFQELANPGDPELNIAVRWEIRGKFSGAQLEKAVQQIIDRHEILRTCFVVDKGELYQEVVESVSFRLGMVDLRAVSPDEHEPRVAAMARELASRPFDLSQPGLLRITLVQLAADRAALLIAAHHMAFDGFSIGVLGHEIGQTMQALAERRAPDLPEIDLQYGDYALWEQEFEGSGALEEAGAFWENRLKDAPYFEIEPDLPRPATRATVGKTITRSFAEDFDHRMIAFTKSAGISFFTFGAAALSAALYQWSGKSDILFATPVAGRTDVEIEKLIGVFINTLVMRLDAQPEATLRAHVAGVGDSVTEALLHQEYPFDRLVRRLKPPRDASRRPLVSINLNMQRAFLQERQYGEFELISVPSHMPGIFYDLNVQIVGRNSGWKLMLDYNTSLFKSETAEEFAELLLETFETILQHPDRKLSELPKRHQPAATPSAHTAAPDQAAQPGITSDHHAEIRDAVQKVWAEVLGRPADECTGDFFDLGGHSLIALRMLARLQETLGQPLSLGTFLQDPTLDGFAATIAAMHASPDTKTPSAETKPSLWSILTLREATADSPVIVSLNQPFLYHALARQIGDNIEVVNLNITGDDNIRRLQDMDFATVASEAATLLHARYSGRPVVLMGHCVDGLLALRIAQQKALAQEFIPLVAMVDSWEPSVFVNRGRRARLSARWMTRLRRWGHFLAARLKGQIGWSDLLQQTRLGNAILRRFVAAPPETEAEQQAFKVNIQLVQLSRRLPSERYAGEVALFRTQAHTQAALRKTFGWAELLPPDTPVYELPGWHEDALKTTGVPKIARILQARIGRHAEGSARYGG